MNYFEVTKYNDYLYQLKDQLGVLVTLVIGEEKALLFDTAYGIGDLPKEVRSITDKPLIVVNSHGHMDHSCGNYQFEKVYIHADDIPLCKKHNSLPWRKRNLANIKALNALPEGFNEDAYLGQNEGKLVIIKVGDIIDLGGLKGEVISMIGHTKGSIGILFRSLRLLLVGDATCPFVWLFLEESEPVSVYTKMLEQVLELPFDNFLVGHGARLFPKSKMVDFYKIAKNIDMNRAVPVSFGGFENANAYCYTLGKMYDQNDCGVVFDPNKL